MGKSKSSKKKNRSNNVEVKAGTEPMEAVASDTSLKRAGEENRTDKSNEPAAGKMESSNAMEASKGEVSSKTGASQVDEKEGELTKYKNKLHSLKANLKTVQKNSEEKDITIKKLTEEKDSLEAKNSQLSRDLAELRAKCKQLEKQRSQIVNDSESFAMEDDATQEDSWEQEKEKETNVQCLSFQEQPQMDVDGGKPSTSQGAEKPTDWWEDQGPSTSGDVKQLKTHPDTKIDGRRPSEPKRGWERGVSPDRNRSFGDKHTGNAKQPGTSSHYEQSNKGKQASWGGYHQDVRDGCQNEMRRDRQGREPRHRDQKWDGNQNYRMDCDRSSSRLRVEAPAEYKIVNEVDGDVFQATDDHSLAHCVAEDMRMGSGIAVLFRQKFNCVSELLNQRKRQGDVAVLEHSQRYIYYLVTKRLSTGKPTMDTLWRSLKAMRDHVEKHKVAKIAMPRIGCGLDRLEWDRVKPLIENVFSGLDVTITVYNYRQGDGKSGSKKQAKSQNAKGSNLPVNKKNSSKRKRKSGRK